MHRSGIEDPLDDHVRFPESLLRVALDMVDILVDVRRSVAALAVILRAILLMQYRSALRKTLRSSHHRGNGFVLHIDEIQGLLGVVDGIRGDSGDGMTLVEHFLAGHQRLAQVFMLAVLGEIGSGRHCTHPGMRLGPTRIDRQNPRVRVRTPQDLPKEQSCGILIRAVFRRPRYLVCAVMPKRPLANGLELALR